VRGPRNWRPRLLPNPHSQGGPGRAAADAGAAAHPEALQRAQLRPSRLQSDAPPHLPPPFPLPPPPLPPPPRVGLDVELLERTQQSILRLLSAEEVQRALSAGGAAQGGVDPALTTAIADLHKFSMVQVRTSP
jgi:hypothetical protein